MSTAYFRLLYIVNADPGTVPFGAGVDPRVKGQSKSRPGSLLPSNAQSEGTMGHAYENTTPGAGRDMDPDSPGLERFYSRDVFVCEGDGRPRWCSECDIWKPDRAHHSRDVGRCVRKFDHFCPWVGGVVAENSFKFFLQFVAYTWLYCTFLLVVMAFYLHEQITRGRGWDQHFAAIIGLASFFGLFTFGMTCSHTTFALANLTTVENLNKATVVWQLAVLIPSAHLKQEHLDATQGATADIGYRTITYPLPLPSKMSLSATPQTDTSRSPESQPEDTQRTTGSQRDAQATRTFAILQMKKGLSPWDLGMVDNWKSVMGPSFPDWISPLSKRSPCCNHDEGESQYPTGRWFEHLLAENGFISPNEIRKPRPFLGRKAMEAESIRMDRLKPATAEGSPV